MNNYNFLQQFFIDGAFRVCDTNADGWVNVDEYTEILRWFGRGGCDLEAGIQFLFKVYDVNGMLHEHCNIMIELLNSLLLIEPKFHLGKATLFTFVIQCQYNKFRI